MKIIPLHGKRGNGKNALVSDEDYESLIKYRWTLDSYGYALRSAHKDLGKGKTISMHRQVFGSTDAFRIDHIDRNSLNNQRENLREATQTQNLQNRGEQSNNTSGYKGVCYLTANGHQRRKRWIAQIKIDGKQKRIGYFHTAKEAALAYNDAASSHFGEYAYLNPTD